MEDLKYLETQFSEIEEDIIDDFCSTNGLDYIEAKGKFINSESYIITYQDEKITVEVGNNDSGDRVIFVSHKYKVEKAGNPHALTNSLINIKNVIKNG